MKLNKKWIAAGAIVLVLTVPFIIKKTRGNKGTEVDVVTVAEQDIRPTILASGTLAFRTEINLTSELLAKVQSIEVEEGDEVEAGQLLLTLDPKTYQNAIDREEATRRQSLISIERQKAVLALREKQFARSQQLLAARMIDQGRFDEERNQLQLARVELKSSEEALRRANAVVGDAREQLTKTDIRAPIAGTIVALPIKVGETAIPSTNSLVGAQLMKLADTSAIQAELKVDEGDIANVVIDQSVEVFAAAYPETPIKGTVQQVALAPLLDNQGRAYKVVVLLDADPELKLRSGMTVRANIFLSDGSRKLSVPVQAVQSDSDEAKKITHRVWRVQQGLAERVDVELGASDDQWQEITSGLAAGDQVIIGPSRTIRGLAAGTAVSASEKTDDEESDEKAQDEQE